MINRENFKDIQSFLDYQIKVKQVTEATKAAYWARLKHSLIWADSKTFTTANKFKLSFPAYLEGYQKETLRRFTPAGVAAICKTVRAFFSWARREYPRKYGALSESWIESIKPARGRGEQSEIRTREIYTVEDVRKIMAVKPQTIAEQRTRAAVAFLFLSGMRIGAFMTLPMGAVNLTERTVRQDPNMGVHTKNGKAAITYLYEIPDLLEVVEEWDKFLKDNPQAGGYWFIHLSSFGTVKADDIPKGNRDNLKRDFGRDLREICKKAGVTYHSPHKLRHGHVVYSMKRARTLEDFKAISQNVMHSSLGITDSIYGVLTAEDVSTAIGRLSKEKTGQEPKGDLADRLRGILAELERKEG
ncbi:MAG: site-specific integrase [Anaerolineaceae bacterium]|nr:site-specific integrase [Anaerolineaceae bacterium]